ncbi:hypothetical protein OE88DRAFT_263931 [Heliocybe sulcata]|uniref:Uncharacterized protein n=1 Tax=Heliocybe sulcata TaxID=5364 RepID=A0A5C3N0E9_9AGAM|nr:hypothetical protein OE88DRAFT_263931 [Heliocybe sulcata]
MTATTSAPVINGITGRDIYNDTVCAYAWGLSNREQYNTNATFNAVLANCIGNLLQADGENFWAAYCNNPPDDGCPYGYCPNSDVAGPITRISAYFTSFATACLLEIASDKNELVWSQLITIWSILVSTCISIAHGRQLGRVHAELALLIVGSPLTCSMWTRTVVSLRHFRRHKWGAVSITRQFLLICAFVTYIVFAVLSRLPNTGRLFSQESCYQKDINVFAPFFLLTDVGLYTCSIALAIVSLLSIVEWNRRKVAWLEKRGNWYLRWSNVKEFRYAQ